MANIPEFEKPHRDPIIENWGRVQKIEFAKRFLVIFIALGLAFVALQAYSQYVVDSSPLLSHGG